MSYESLDDSVAISRMAYALRGYAFIESAFIRADAYDQFDVPPLDIARFDRQALFTEQMRRRLFGIIGASVIAMAPATMAHAAECVALPITWGAVGERIFAVVGMIAAGIALAGFIGFLCLGKGRTIKSIIEDEPERGDGDNIPHTMENYR